METRVSAMRHLTARLRLLLVEESQHALHFLDEIICFGPGNERLHLVHLQLVYSCGAPGCLDQPLQLVVIDLRVQGGLQYSQARWMGCGCTSHLLQLTQFETGSGPRLFVLVVLLYESLMGSRCMVSLLLNQWLQLLQECTIIPTLERFQVQQIHGPLWSECPCLADELHELAQLHITAEVGMVEDDIT